MVTSNTRNRGDVSGAARLGRRASPSPLRRCWPASASASQAQVDLTTYTDAKGYLNVRGLTCAQLANTYQEDANFLGAWYSGWWNGHLKWHSINIARAKQGLHEVIVYCKANPGQ